MSINLKEVKAFVFDMDGTLANSSKVIYEAYQLALKDRGIELNKKEIESIREKKANHLFEDWGLNEEENLAAVEKMNNYCKEHVERVEIFPGIPEILKELKEMGFPLALWTGRGQKAAFDILKAHNLFDFFQVILGSTNVTKNKPHPEALELISKELNIPTEKMVMIGDHDHDILGGRNGNTHTIRADWRDSNPSHIRLHDADITFETTEEFLSWLKSNRA